MFASNLLAAAPVVDIDGTFFIQAGIYLGLVLVLRPLLFKPWLEVQARRHASIEGAVVKAKTLRADADELASRYDQRLEAARDQALSLRSQLRREEEASQARKLAEARDLASAALDQQRERIARETAEARAALGGRVDDLAEQISQKLLGRTP